MVAFFPVPFLDVDAERHVSSAAGGEVVLNADQVTGHHGEQVAGLGKGIVPDRVVAVAVEFTAFQEIAVGKQYRAGGAVGDDGDGIDRQDVGPVREVGNGTETLCLALGAEHAGGAVEALQEGIFLGAEFGGHRQGEGGRHDGYGQPLLVHRVLFAGEGGPVDAETDQDGALTVQAERPRPLCGSMVRSDRQAGVDQGGFLRQFEAEFNGIDKEVGRGVILAVHGAVLGFGHGFLDSQIWSVTAL